MTLFFNQYAAGFSETFYHPSMDPTTLQVTIPNSLYKAAAAFRHVSVILKAVRFSRVEAPKASVLWLPSPRAQGTRYSDEEPGPDAVSTTAVYVLSTQTNQRRRIWCRGLADVDVTRDAFGNDIESASLIKMRNNYFLALNEAGFCIRYGDRPPAGGLTWKNVTKVYLKANPVSPSTRCTIQVVEAAAGFAVGDIVQFDGVPGTLPRFPRTNRIEAVNAGAGVTDYQIAYSLPGGVTVDTGKLRVTRAQSSNALITRWSFERFGEHKTGRPFGSLRGRSRGVSLSR